MSEVPPHIAERLNRTLQENELLRSQVQALEAMHGKAPAVLVDVAAVLRNGRHLGDPAVSSVPADSEGRGKPGSRPPSGGDRAARGALRGFENTIDRAVKTYYSRRDNNWRRPDVDDGVDRTTKVRCRRRGCALSGKWREPVTVTFQEDGDVVASVVWDCPECGHEYPNHPAASDGGRSV